MVVLFYLLSFLIILSAFLVLISKNPIHSILFLILVFIGSSGLLILLKVEFLGMIFMIIYVGAISVLFLFVIMMLNIRLMELKENLIKYVPLTLLLGCFLAFEVFYLISSVLRLDLSLIFDKNLLFYFQYIDYYSLFLFSDFTNLQLLGYFLYTYFVDYFLICGLILFVAMVGAIKLTFHNEFLNKKQDLFLQINRNFARTVKNIEINKHK